MQGETRLLSRGLALSNSVIRLARLRAGRKSDARLRYFKANPFYSSRIAHEFDPRCARYSYFITNSILFHDEEWAMAGSFDDLIGFLLGEIALCGDQGA